MNNLMLKKSYTKPSLNVVKVDTELSLVMVSDPPLDPGAGPSGIGTGPAFVQKAINILIR